MSRSGLIEHENERHVMAKTWWDASTGVTHLCGTGPIPKHRCLRLDRKAG